MATYRVKTTLDDLMNRGLVNSPHSLFDDEHEQSINNDELNDYVIDNEADTMDKGYVFAESTHFE